MAILRPRIWTRQPQFAVGIDWSNPITQGLHCELNYDGYDAVSGNLPTGLVGTKKIPIGTNGIARGFGATRGVGTTDTYLSGVRANTDKYSVLAVLASYSFGGGGFGRVFQKGNGFEYESALFQNNDSISLGFIHNGPGGIKQAGAVVIPSSGTPFVFVGVTNTAGGVGTNTVNGQFVSLYINGILGTHASATVDHNALRAVTTIPYRVGNRSDLVRVWDGYIWLILMWGRELSPLEVKSVSANPWQIFAPRVT